MQSVLTYDITNYKVQLNIETKSCNSSVLLFLLCFFLSFIFLAFKVFDVYFKILYISSDSTSESE